MQPREFIVLAEELAKVNAPANIRSAISRAYYAAFHAGAASLRQLGFHVSKGGAAHGEVARCFWNSGDPETVEAANGLSSLHSSRILADYQLTQLRIEYADDAREIIEHARSIIETFEGLPNNPQRPRIHAAIAAWRKSNGYPS